MTGLADEIEIAKPTLFDVCGLAMAVLMPMTLPFESTSGPPELPGLIAASVWMALNSVSLPTSTTRSRPEMMPVVTVAPLPSDRPSALPMATTESPTWSWSESPSSRVGRPVLSTFTTARSRRVSAPTTLPVSASAVGEVHHHLVLPFDDVRVRDDHAARVDDEAGSRCFAAVRCRRRCARPPDAPRRGCCGCRRA